MESSPSSGPSHVLFMCYSAKNIFYFGLQRDVTAVHGKVQSLYDCYIFKNILFKVL